MLEVVRLSIDGETVTVPRGTTVASALVALGKPTRRSRSGEMRAPLCGMGVCYECRVTIDGEPHVRSCMVSCREGMEVQTDA